MQPSISKEDIHSIHSLSIKAKNLELEGISNVEIEKKPLCSVSDTTSNMQNFSDVLHLFSI